MLTLLFLLPFTFAQNSLFPGTDTVDNSLAPSTVVHQVRDSSRPICHTVGQPLDLMFVVDSSGSLRANFEEERQVLKDVIAEVALDPQSTRVALIQYSGIARTEFTFNTFNSTDSRINRANTVKAIDELRFISGITRTGQALRHALDEWSNPVMGARRGVPRMLFLISDGRTYDDVRDLDEQMGAALRNAGIETWAYGTGEWVAIEDLYQIVGTKENVFSKSTQRVVLKNYNDMTAYFDDNYGGVEVCQEAPVCVPGSSHPLDLLFVLDGSGSLQSRFDRQKLFMKDVIGRVNVHPEAVRVSIIQYSHDARVEFSFNQFPSNDAVLSAIDRIHYKSGTTMTGPALDYAVWHVKSDAGRRQSAPVAVVVLTDGRSVHSVDAEAVRLGEAADKVYAIGVSDFPIVDSEELFRTALEWDHVFTSGNLTKFHDEISQITDLSCDGAGEESFLEPVAQAPVTVTCDQRGVELTARSRKPFNGRMYTSGHFDTSECYTLGDGDHSTKLRINANRCGIARTYDNNRNGYTYQGNVMMQYHPTAVTKVDQALDVDCFFAFPISSNQLSHIIGLDSVATNCRYDIRRFAHDGCVALDARVGENFYHTWTCDNDPTLYNFLVHSCYVEAEGRTVQLLDSRGCEIDSHLLRTPAYLNSHTATYGSMFRLPWSGLMRFTCSVQLCAVGADCDRVLPPRCDRKAVTTRKSRAVLPEFVVTTRSLNVLDSETVRPQDEIQYCSAYLR